MNRVAALAASIAVMCLGAEPLLAEVNVPQQRELVAKLCNGGEIRIPIGPADEQPEQPRQHCPDSKGCHAGPCRKQFDPEQRPQET